ncbi:putative protein phosphatase 2C 10 [Acorus calamus]|uniref:protein-serine/threonine phosphatase n=1 Tax=Acorus calamus TaxID=4465 RepID=A0AAV9ER54_ACOCL|nr:putative protein phosphatase 2C 10 [Acorus calamus]
MAMQPQQEINLPMRDGDVPRVNGQLAVSRAFGDKSLKSHLSSDPDIRYMETNYDAELLILASDGLWKVMSNQEAVDLARKIKDPLAAAKELIAEALNRDRETTTEEKSGDTRDAQLSPTLSHKRTEDPSFGLKHE